MIRSILVALDDTEGAVAARDLAFALSRSTGAALTAATVLDWPHVRDAHEAVPPGAAAFKERRDAVRAQRLEAEADAAFAACTAAAGETPFTRLRLTEAPEPALLAAGATHDLIVIGRDSTLGLEVNDDGLAPVIEALLRDGARPLLVVPPGPVPAAGGVLVGYDGSVPAMRDDAAVRAAGPRRRAAGEGAVGRRDAGRRRSAWPRKAPPICAATAWRPRPSPWSGSASAGRAAGRGGGDARAHAGDGRL